MICFIFHLITVLPQTNVKNIFISHKIIIVLHDTPLYPLLPDCIFSFAIINDYRIKNIITITMSHLKAYCLYHNDQAITNFCKDSTPPLTQKIALCRFAPLAFANTPNTIKISRQNRPILAYTKQSLRSRNLFMLPSHSWNKTMPNVYGVFNTG